MLKIKSCEENSFEFYKKVVSSKQSAELKEKLKPIEESQLALFGGYDESFQKSELELVERFGYETPHDTCLRALYSYRSKQVQTLKSKLTVHPNFPNSMMNTCQNCTINEVDTMDHMLGQSAFPEYSVHPKNLFPCCTYCNRKKSDNYVDEHGKRRFLNLFLDELPSSQYLHVEFGQNWLPRFYLEQPEDVDDNTYSLIESHYSELDLLNRFRDSSHQIISTFRMIIRSYGHVDNLHMILRTQIEGLEPLLGANHREIVLKRALAASDAFIAECWE